MPLENDEMASRLNNSLNSDNRQGSYPGIGAIFCLCLPVDEIRYIKAMQTQ